MGYILYCHYYHGSSMKPYLKTISILASDQLLCYNTQKPYNNYFIFLSLLKALKTRKLRVSGTIRENRIPNSPLKKERRYFENFLTDKEIVICKWNGNSVVTISSNSLNVHPFHKVQRFLQVEKIFIQILIE